MAAWTRWLVPFAVTAPVLLVVAACSADPVPTPEPSAAPSPVPRASHSAPPETPEPSPSAEPSALPSPTAAPLAAAYPPRDDCAAKPGWAAFHAKLAKAAEAQDAEAFVALTAPDIKLDYGGGHGAEELTKRLADPRTGLWHELAAILPLGCGFEGGLAAMPWIFWNIPADEVDAYTDMLVIGSDVPLRERAQPKARIIAKLDWALVTIAPSGFDPKARYARVTTQDGTRGYAETARLRSLLGYRLIAEPKDGDWHITAFIAGD